MTTIEVKTEIQHALEQISEESLADILDYIKLIQQGSPISAKRYSNYKKIMAEDDKLFERLAK